MKWQLRSQTGRSAGVLVRNGAHPGPFGRTHAMAPSKCRRAIHRLDSANSVCNWAVFLASPRSRTLAQMLALSFSNSSISRFDVSNGMDAPTFDGINVPQWKRQQPLEPEGVPTMQITTAPTTGEDFAPLAAAITGNVFRVYSIGDTLLSSDTLGMVTYIHQDRSRCRLLRSNCRLPDRLWRGR
jgi:hypothetical protein